jgi:CRISPR/Cas system CMR-associated protein Cmr1 (group 7 of RAMP superfamily)
MRTIVSKREHEVEVARINSPADMQVSLEELVTSMKRDQNLSVPRIQMDFTLHKVTEAKKRESTLAESGMRKLSPRDI